ncbi:MAG: L-aspartate oxidase [Nitrospirales bacterium]|nr:L-aspartate oxidase [Nitrospirales bacterium]
MNSPARKALVSCKSGPATDFIVIGCGIAGLRAAIELARYGHVVMVTKGSPLESSSMYAQGGVAVALNEEDDVHLHFSDTMKAGHQLGQEQAAKVLVEDGPERIQELVSWGTQFDTVDGKFAFTKEGAHSRSRIIRARGDATGDEIVRVLLSQARQHPTITWLDHHFSIDLLMTDGRCSGVLVFDEATGDYLTLSSTAVVLATGGAGQIYSRTSNPASATGDGMGMAYRAGATLVDLEFVQFHPTSLFLPSSPPFLLSETMRGEGGLLRNRKGDLFMKQYHPAAELAPRDIVARAIWSEMAATRSRHMYLDVTHLGSTFIRNRFPTIYTTCLRFDIDITEEWIPVSPSAHYMMGGIQTNIGGATGIPGLFAAGEVACNGVHGANRLASNSLLEGLVFGVRAAQSAMDTKTARTLPHPTNDLPLWTTGIISRTTEDVEKIRSSLRRLMWGKIGLVRTGESLVSALAQLHRWERTMRGPFHNRAGYEVKNMIQVGRCITEAALWRENSLGAHFRADFPDKKGRGWKTHSQLQQIPEQHSSDQQTGKVG